MPSTTGAIVKGVLVVGVERAYMLVVTLTRAEPAITAVEHDGNLAVTVT